MDDDPTRSIENEEQSPAPPDARAGDVASTNGHHHERQDVVARTGEHYGWEGHQDLDAERSIAGALLVGGNPVADNVRAAGLEASHLVDPTARAVVDAALELHDDGAPIDVITIADILGGATTGLAAPGTDGITSTGRAALASLMATCVSTSAAAHHARIVVAHARQRALGYALVDATEAFRERDQHRLDAALDRAVTVADDPVQTEPATLNVHWVHDTLEEPPPADEDLIGGILCRGELTGIGAPRNVGKSWLGMNMATLLSRGAGLFLGELPIRSTARSLFCHGEMNRKGARGRWHHLTGAYEPTQGVGETFEQWRLRVVEHRRSINNGGVTDSDRWYDVVLEDSLEHTIARHDIDVLFIDPWAVYYAGVENSNDEVEAALDKLRKLADAHDLAVVIFHHLRGGTDGEATDPEDAWRGATRLPDGVDNRITLLPHYTRKQAKDQGMTRKQSRRYQDVYFLRRSGPAPDDFSIAWNPATGWWERWRTGAELGAERGGRPAAVHYNPVDVADVLREIGGSWPSIRKASEDLGLSASAAAGLLERAVAAGHIDEYHAGKGRGFRLPGHHDHDPLEGLDDTP